ncbi:hypothetical protein KVH30_02020 [Streptomyces olivaceus]|uniref:hypothetical protein n=1 Tax=Streptomyces olivaceus TaxID=47716 RepID=UPI001CCFA416|nr:hypothetical protein [Streptomyces olivaceus]MBZ6290348.1 hypothetical protein [Streptomyces olivaceus]MBZ6324300.1 hypothetical protein [Streptomyces olivaceus]
MSAYERLMAEAVPTGTFGRARPERPREAPSRPSWTPEEQAAHRAELEAALVGFETRGPRRPLLRVIDGTAATGPTPPPDACTCARCSHNPTSTTVHRGTTAA